MLAPKRHELSPEASEKSEVIDNFAAVMDEIEMDGWQDGGSKGY